MYWKSYVYICPLKNVLNMKKTIIIPLFLLLSAVVFSQTTLTYETHSLRPGDSTRFITVPYTNPGEAGPAQIWNFSGLEASGPEVKSFLPMPSDPSLKTTGDHNIVLAENDNRYFYRLSADALLETGATTSEYILNFQDPVLKMLYPFSYGNRFSDQFSAIAETNTGHQVAFSGTYSVVADGYGSLILPDRTLKDVIRVRTETSSLEINQCNTIETHAVRYLWYASNERYPVLNLTETSYTIGGKPHEVKRTALLNLMPESMPEVTSPEDPKNPAIETVTLVVYPNPFQEELNYHYFLRKAMQVSVSLLDLNGKTIANPVSNRIQQEGLYSGSIDAIQQHLVPGVYTLRMVFDNQVIIRKVIKL